MTRMVRKQIYLEKRQLIGLRRLARARGVSEAEIIRQALDQQLATGAVTPHPRDSAALEAAFRFALARRQHGSTGRPYRWKREEACENRSARVGRSRA